MLHGGARDGERGLREFAHGGLGGVQEVWGLREGVDVAGEAARLRPELERDRVRRAGQRAHPMGGAYALEAIDAPRREPAHAQQLGARKRRRQHHGEEPERLAVHGGPVVLAHGDHRQCRPRRLACRVVCGVAPRQRHLGAPCALEALRKVARRVRRQLARPDVCAAKTLGPRGARHARSVMLHRSGGAPPAFSVLKHVPVVTRAVGGVGAQPLAI